MFLRKPTTATVIEEAPRSAAARKMDTPTRIRGVPPPRGPNGPESAPRPRNPSATFRYPRVAWRRAGEDRPGADAGQLRGLDDGKRSRTRPSPQRVHRPQDSPPLVVITCGRYAECVWGRGAR
jgi:hypothetical protein